MTSPSPTPPSPPPDGTDPPTEGSTPPPPNLPPSPGEPATLKTDDTSTADTFPRSYVEELRTESAGYRTKAQRADKLAAALVTELARSSGRLADPTDLPFSDELLDENGMPSGEKVTAAVEALIKSKPHLADRRPTGSVDQGARAGAAPEFDFGALLRTAAGG